MKLEKEEFELFQKIVFNESGISLNESKTSLIENRLYSRILFYKFNLYSEYIDVLHNNKEELNKFINLITTNETSFFREKQHFDFLKTLAIKYKSKDIFKVWSAASSVGAEAYSIAMVLEEQLVFNQWSIIASDINTDVIVFAKQALFNETLISKIPNEYRKRYCLKGKKKYKGKFIINKELLNNIDFRTFNLINDTMIDEKFDVIFLRNVLIYFNKETKKIILDKILKNLKIGAFLIISITESLDILDIKNLKKITGSIYEKVQ